VIAAAIGGRARWGPSGRLPADFVLVAKIESIRVIVCNAYFDLFRGPLQVRLQRPIRLRHLLLPLLRQSVVAALAPVSLIPGPLHHVPPHAGLTRLRPARALTRLRRRHRLSGSGNERRLLGRHGELYGGAVGALEAAYHFTLGFDSFVILVM
jgi:hypothetical protein